MENTEHAQYRKNVAIVVLGQSGKILACERADVPGAWQIPQGGIEVGENPVEAMQRELLEEIGATPLNIIAQMPDPVIYDWPEHLHRRGFIGQEQVYFLVEIDETAPLVLGPEDRPEFERYEWLSVDSFFSRLSGFKKTAYIAGISYFVEHHSELFEQNPTNR